MTTKIVHQVHGSLERRKRGRPKTLNLENAKIKILSEARRLFLDWGYRRLTMEELALRCEMSKKTIYTLFPSKRAILGSILDDERGSILGLPFEDDSVCLTNALRHIFRMDSDDEVRFERMAMMRLCRQETPVSEEAELTLIQDIYDASARQFGDWVTRQVALGRMRVIDPGVATTIMFEMFFGGLFTQDKKIKHWNSRDERRRYMEECLRVFVEGTKSECTAITLD